MWPRANCVYIYLPGGENGSEDSPSDFYDQVKATLEEVGLDTPSWSYKYNAGANPIAFPLPLEKASHSAICEILETAYQLA